MLVNLTPHDVNLLDKDNKLLKTYKSQGLVRLKTTTERVGVIETSDGLIIPINETIFGDVQGLPAPQRGFMYIVSAMVKQSLPKRDDLLVPDEMVRDNGVIIGCRAFR